MQKDTLMFADFVRVLWVRKAFIVMVVVVFAVASLVYGYSLPNKYRVDVLLAPTKNSGAGGDGISLSQLSGVASLAGLSLGADQIDQTRLALETLTSRQFMRNFITKNKLLVPIIAAKGWDASTGALIIDASVYDENEGTWVQVDDETEAPTTMDAYEVLAKSLTLDVNNKSGLVRVGLVYYSPYLASEWLDSLIKELNEYFKEKEIVEATKSIDYLQAQLERTEIADMQKVFYRLIEEQTKRVLLAEVKDQFVFEIVDPPVAVDKKYEPNRALILIAGALMGGVLAIGWVIARAIHCNSPDHL